MEEFGGSVNVFPLMKSLYRADRRMLQDFGRTITGDNYSSMPKGPILSMTYDFVRGKSASGILQGSWNAAFVTSGNKVTAKGIVDLGPLAPVEVDFLREEARLVKRKMIRGENVARWMHETCPEWQQVPQGTSRPLHIERILRFLPGHEDTDASMIKERMRHGEQLRSADRLSARPLLIAVG